MAGDVYIQNLDSEPQMTRMTRMEKDSPIQAGETFLRLRYFQLAVYPCHARHSRFNFGFRFNLFGPRAAREPDFTGVIPG
jgi:hypothetical protein